MLGGKRNPPFLLLARRPFVTGDIIESVGLLYLEKDEKKEIFQNKHGTGNLLRCRTMEKNEYCTFQGT